MSTEPPVIVKQSSYRAGVGLVVERVNSYAWVLLLPAAAECTASVWFPQVTFGGIDMQLAALNVTGALMEGFFAAWESGRAVANGPVGRALEFLADDVRGSFLSTYTSWAGMVGFAAALAHEQQSLSAGILYTGACVASGFVAHGLGNALAVGIFSDPPASDAVGLAARSFRGGTTHNALLGAIMAYIAYTYLLVRTGLEDFEDSDQIDVRDDGQLLPALIAFLDYPSNRLLVAMSFSVMGAATGNAVGNLVDEVLANPSSTIPRGTLVCNSLFAALSLSLQAATLHCTKWQRSVLLTSFAGSFCGAASAFAGHASDTRNLYRELGLAAALANVLANLALSALPFVIALELERLLTLRDSGELDVNGDALVSVRELGAFYGLMEPPLPCVPARRLLWWQLAPAVCPA